ncbi:MAG: TerB family tellurite resistance protein [Planctomycetota bacterium]|jgi:tellurite resistance protein
MPDQLEILRAACCVAGLDQTIDDRERQLAQVLAKRAGVGAVSLRAMLDQAREEPERFDEYLQFLRANKDDAMKTLFQVAVVDGQLRPEERVVLDFFAQRIGIEPSRFDALLRAAEREI